MYESLRVGARDARAGRMFADGVAVKRVGEECFALAREHVDEDRPRRHDEICAVFRMFLRTRARSSSRPVLSPWRVQKIRSARRHERPAAGGDQQWRKHELRPAAARASAPTSELRARHYSRRFRRSPAASCALRNAGQHSVTSSITATKMVRPAQIFVASPCRKAAASASRSPSSARRGLRHHRHER